MMNMKSWLISGAPLAAMGDDLDRHFNFVGSMAIEQMGGAFRYDSVLTRSWVACQLAMNPRSKTVRKVADAVWYMLDKKFPLRQIAQCSTWPESKDLQHDDPALANLEHLPPLNLQTLEGLYNTAARSICSACRGETHEQAARSNALMVYVQPRPPLNYDVSWSKPHYARGLKAPYERNVRRTRRVGGSRRGHPRSSTRHFVRKHGLTRKGVPAPEPFYRFDYAIQCTRHQSAEKSLRSHLAASHGMLALHDKD